MNRINSIRNLALAIVLTGLSLVGGAGCAGETADQDVLIGDLNSRGSYFVSADGDDDPSTNNGGHALDNRRPLVHPNAGNNLGPRPEPWMSSDGEANGPRPEPWAPNGTPDDSSGSSSGPPSNGSSSSGGTSTSSSGGTPGNPNPTSK